METVTDATMLTPAVASTLLRFLRESLPNWKGRTVKDRLQGGCVLVNGTVVTHHAFALSPGDTVEIRKTSAAAPRPAGGIEVLLHDDAVVGILKPAGLLSVGTSRVKSQHALGLVRDALGPNQRLWPVHRLDRETSGVLLFARSREVCDAIQAGWRDVDKIYLAVVEGRPDPSDGLISQPLRDDKNLTVRVGPHKAARDARTRYRTLQTQGSRALVELALETGRRHQIRAHLAWLGTPVVGDGRYGTRGPRMALHAHRLTFPHPVSGEVTVLEAPAPSFFGGLMRPPRPR